MTPEIQNLVLAALKKVSAEHALRPQEDRDAKDQYTPQREPQSQARSA